MTVLFYDATVQALIRSDLSQTKKKSFCCYIKTGLCVSTYVSVCVLYYPICAWEDLFLCVFGAISVYKLVGGRVHAWECSGGFFHLGEQNLTFDPGPINFLIPSLLDFQLHQPPLVQDPIIQHLDRETSLMNLSINTITRWTIINDCSIVQVITQSSGGGTIFTFVSK